MLYVYNFNVTVKKSLHVLALDYIAVAVSGKVGPVRLVNHTSWVAVVTPTDRPKSVRNRCLIELFCGVVCVVSLPFWHFCWCRGFCHRTESDLFLFLFSSCFISYQTNSCLIYHIITNIPIESRFIWNTKTGNPQDFLRICKAYSLCQLIMKASGWVNVTTSS